MRIFISPLRPKSFWFRFVFWINTSIQADTVFFYHHLYVYKCVRISVFWPLSISPLSFYLAQCKSCVLRMISLLLVIFLCVWMPFSELCWSLLTSHARQDGPVIECWICTAKSKPHPVWCRFEMFATLHLQLLYRSLALKRSWFIFRSMVWTMCTLPVLRRHVFLKKELVTQWFRATQKRWFTCTCRHHVHVTFYLVSNFHKDSIFKQSLASFQPILTCKPTYTFTSSFLQ